MLKREYDWQSPVECPNCRMLLLIRKVFWYTEFDYEYLFQCKICSEERRGRLVAKNEYVPFWNEEIKVAKRIEEETPKRSGFKVAKRVIEEK